MFAGKITEQARSKLLCCLLPLYKEGYHCLLRCSSLHNNFNVFIERPTMAVNFETDEVDKSKLNLELTCEIFHWKLPLRTKILQSDKVIQDLDRLISENDRNLECEVLNIWKKETFQNAQLSRASDVESIINSQTDTTSHLLYAALCNYREGRFDAAIQLATEAKTKLHGPWVQYPWRPSVARYKAAGGDYKSFTQMTRETVAWPIDLAFDFSIPELFPEHYFSMMHMSDVISVPPLVMANFLLFHSFFRKENFVCAMSMLEELYVIIYYDNQYHIDESDKATSWQILGICQEISGYYREAIHSYTNVLHQQMYPELRLSSMMRIRNISQQMSA